MLLLGRRHTCRLRRSEYKRLSQELMFCIRPSKHMYPKGLCKVKQIPKKRDNGSGWVGPDLTLRKIGIAGEKSLHRG